MPSPIIRYFADSLGTVEKIELESLGQHKRHANIIYHTLHTFSPQRSIAAWLMTEKKTGGIVSFEMLLKMLVSPRAIGDSALKAKSKQRLTTKSN